MVGNQAFKPSFWMTGELTKGLGIGIMDWCKISEQSKKVEVYLLPIYTSNLYTSHGMYCCSVMSYLGFLSKNSRYISPIVHSSSHLEYLVVYWCLNL